MIGRYPLALGVVRHAVEAGTGGPYAEQITPLERTPHAGIVPRWSANSYWQQQDKGWHARSRARRAGRATAAQRSGPTHFGEKQGLHSFGGGRLLYIVNRTMVSLAQGRCNVTPPYKKHTHTRTRSCTKEPHTQTHALFSSRTTRQYRHRQSYQAESSPLNYFEYAPRFCRRMRKRPCSRFSRAVVSL